MQFEWTITVGNIFTFGLTLFTILGVAWRMWQRFEKMEWKLQMIWKWYAKQHKIDNGNDKKLD